MIWDNSRRILGRSPPPLALQSQGRKPKHAPEHTGGASNPLPRRPRHHQEASKNALGRTWAALGRSWVALGRSWPALGSPLGSLGPLLSPWSPLPKNTVFLDVFGPWALLGRPWVALGSPWDLLGMPLGPSQALLGSPWGSQSALGPPWGRSWVHPFALEAPAKNS